MVGQSYRSPDWYGVCLMRSASMGWLYTYIGERNMAWRGYLGTPDEQQMTLRFKDYVSRIPHHVTGFKTIQRHCRAIRIRTEISTNNKKVHPRKRANKQTSTGGPFVPEHKSLPPLRPLSHQANLILTRPKRKI
jgi:hypothetical protein